MPSLVDAAITFRTNDENKDHDTNVTTEVRDREGRLVAQASDTYGPFDDQTSHGPFDLQILNKEDKSDLDGGTALIRIDPKGDDTWRFNFLLALHFDDGSELSAEADGLELNESTEQTQTFAIH